MINLKMWGTRHERGQTAIMAGLSMVVLVTLVGLVIDGGFAWGRQRQTQNGSDSVATAGGVVIQHHLALQGAPTDGDVCDAIMDAALVNQVVFVSAEYTDEEGGLLGVPVGDCASTAPIPTDAQGVKVTTEQTFDTFVAGVFGMQTWTALADATAVVAQSVGVCPASAGCGALPVTFPQSFDVCDDTNANYEIAEIDVPGSGWIPYELLPEDAVLDESNLAIIPLCPDNPGSVGWLDFGCGNLAEHIEDPCNQAFPIPSWEQTHTGNINCCESQLNALAGPLWGEAEDADKVTMIPIHNNTCSQDVVPDVPDDPTCMPLDAEWSGNGNNNYFHMLFWIGFKIDQAHVSGSDNECQQAPGQPQIVNPGGNLGCLKGWIVGRFEAPSTVQIGDINPGDPVPTYVVLVE